MTRREPMVSAELFGRSREESELMDILGDPDSSLVTITGIGGAGKTTLARKLCSEMALAFPDGSYFIELSDLEHSGQLLTRILSSVSAGYSGKAAVTLLREVLREKQLLLILDNFEHVIAASSLIEDAIPETGSSRILITSRTALGIPSERVYRLGGIAVPRNDTESEAASVRLFISLLGKSFEDKDDDLRMICRICRAVGGIPLALKLVSAMALEKSLEEVYRAVAVNDVMTMRMETGERRHSSLRRVFTYSWNLLVPDERRALVSLPVFRGEFTGDAASSVTGTDREVLAGLCRKSLLEKVPSGGYSIHPLIRAFSGNRAREMGTGTGGLQRKHTVYFCRLLQERGAELSGSDPSGAMELFRRCMPDLLPAVRNAVASGMTDEVKKVMQPLRDLLVWSGLAETGAEIFQEILQLFKGSSDDLIDQILIHLGAFYTESARYDQAVPCLEKVCRNGDPGSSAAARFSLGRVYMRTGNLNRAEEHFLSGLEQARKAGEPVMEARVLSGLGDLYNHMFDVPRAEYFLDQAIRKNRETGEAAGLYSNLITLSNLMFNNRRGEEALKYAGEASDLAARLSGETYTALADVSMADALQLLGRSNEALPYALRGVRVYESTGLQRGMQTAYSALTNVYRNQGDVQECLRTAEKLEKISLQIGATYNTMEYLLIAGEAYELGGLTERAAEVYERSLKIALNLKIERHIEEIRERLERL